MFGLVGFVFLFGAFYFARKAYRDSKVIDREKFNRLNEYGVEQFSSYEEYEAAQRRERGTAGAGSAYGCLAMLLGLAGLATIVGGFGSLLR